VLVIQSPTNGLSNCDTAAAAAAAASAGDPSSRVMLRQARARSAENEAASNDDRRWLGQAYRKQLSTWDSIRSKCIVAVSVTTGTCHPQTFQ